VFGGRADVVTAREIVRVLRHVSSPDQTRLNVVLVRVGLNHKANMFYTAFAAYLFVLGDFSGMPPGNVM
jgi:hypothetical protein